MEQLLSQINEIDLEEADWKQALGILALTGVLLAGVPANITFAKPEITWSRAQSRYADDENIVAKVIAGEAAGEGYEGMKAVACIIQNRCSKYDLLPAPPDIVVQKYQFSALIDPSMMERNYKNVKDEADELASKIGKLDDITGGATNYVTKSLYDKVKDDPGWAKKHNLSWILRMERTKQIGNHVFLK